MRLWTADGEPEPSAPPSLIVCSFIALSAVAALLSVRAVTPAMAHGVLPRWDLAAHLLNGWTPFHHLATGRLVDFLWDVWSQGYWPPGQSLFQVPFYATLGGGLSAGLHSSIAAFVLTGVGAVLLLGSISGRRAWLQAAIVLAFMTTSPFFLAYASVAMSEMVGALAQVFVLVCYARYERSHTAGATRWFAGSLSVLFFTKYNYFILLAVPLACHVFLRETPSLSARGRLLTLWHAARVCLTTTPGKVTAVYAFIVAAVIASGGFAFSLAGQRVAFRTVGYAIHPLLYAGLAYAWRTHRQGRWGWERLTARDPRLKPLLLWLVAPLTVWLASPYPNHIKDLAYLVINIPMGQPSAQLGLTGYLTAIQTDYFPHPAVFAISLTAFVVAVARYRHQCSLTRLLMLTAMLQFAMVTAHHTRDARFILLAMPPFWVVSAAEIGGWMTRRHPTTATVASVLVLGAGLATAGTVTTGGPFRRLAFENYVTSAPLADAFAAIRSTIPQGGQVVVVGTRDSVSPSLVRWQLGPPSGTATFPHEVVRGADLPLLDTADMIVHVEPSEVPVERATRRVMDHVRAGVLVPSGVFAIAELDVTIRVFRRGRLD